MLKLHNMLRLFVLLALLGVTACKGSTGAPPAAARAEPDVVLGLRPQETCEPRVDPGIVDTLNALGNDHDAQVSARMKAMYEADQAQRAGGMVPGGEPASTPGQDGVTRVQPPAGQPGAAPQQGEPGTSPHGQPTPSEADRKKMEEEFKKADAADRQRRTEVMGYLRQGKITAADDLGYAAAIFQHGTCLDHFALAHLLAAKAVERGNDWARPLYALTLDRYLVAAGKPQRFGTQYVPVAGKPGKCELAPVDPATTDEERKQYGVKTLAEAQAWAASGNVVCGALMAR